MDGVIDVSFKSLKPFGDKLIVEWIITIIGNGIFHKEVEMYVEHQTKLFLTNAFLNGHLKILYPNGLNSQRLAILHGIKASK